MSVADASGLLTTGGDLAPSTVVAAYASGIFPMPVGRRRRLGWWSPDPRGVLPPENLVVTRSLRRSLRRYQLRVDTDFVATMRQCGDPNRPHGWITPEFLDAYAELHRLGVAHSVEAWLDDVMVGGLYGISLGGFFAGESMFHHERDASKVALVGLVGLLGPGRLLDVQWCTPHLASLGAIPMARSSYLAALRRALAQPPVVFPRGVLDTGAGSTKS